MAKKEPGLKQWQTGLILVVLTLGGHACVKYMFAPSDVPHYNQMCVDYYAARVGIDYALEHCEL